MVTDMGWMFNREYAFNQDISGWDVGSVTDMGSMFRMASAFNQDISGWYVGSVTHMGGMFEYASSFNQDISGWDVGSVMYMDFMFASASAFNQNLCPWKNVIPFIWNTDIFADSGCTYKTTPTGLSGPFCAAAIDTCINPCFPDNTMLQTAIIYYID